MQGCSQALRQPWGGFACPIPPPCHLCSSLGTPFLGRAIPRVPPSLRQGCPRAVPVLSHRGKMEKEKERARLAGVIQAEPSAAELAEDMQKERRLFQLHMCEVGAAPGGSGPFGVGGTQGAAVQGTQSLSPAPERSQWVQRGALVCPRVSPWGPGSGTLLSPPRGMWVQVGHPAGSTGHCTHILRVLVLHLPCQTRGWHLGQKAILLDKPLERRSLSLQFGPNGKTGDAPQVPKHTEGHKPRAETWCQPPPAPPFPSPGLSPIPSPIPRAPGVQRAGCAGRRQRRSGVGAAGWGWAR